MGPLRATEPGMDARVGWALAVVAIALGWVQYGWRGVLLVVSGIVFWLLLQFTRALRAMRTAGGAPVGHVDSAVMLQSQLKRGQRLMDVIVRTRSLGQKVEPAAADGAAPAPADAESFRWADGSGAWVVVHLAGGRVTHWEFGRAETATPSGGDAPAAGT